jgi:hypothetical protein
MTKERLEEARTTIDASIVEILQGLTDVDIIMNAEKEKIFLTKTVQTNINQDRDSKDRLSLSAVGRIIKRLGFSARHTERGNGWLYNTEHLEMLKEIYQIPKPTSEPAGPSVTLVVWNSRDKPTTEATHDATHDSVSEDEKDSPAHTTAPDKGDN